MGRKKGSEQHRRTLPASPHFILVCRVSAASSIQQHDKNVTYTQPFWYTRLSKNVHIHPDTLLANINIVLSKETTWRGLTKHNRSSYHKLLAPSQLPPPLPHTRPFTPSPFPPLCPFERLLACYWLYFCVCIILVQHGR